MACAVCARCTGRRGRALHALCWHHPHIPQPLPCPTLGHGHSFTLKLEFIGLCLIKVASSLPKYTAFDGVLYGTKAVCSPCCRGRCARHTVSDLKTTVHGSPVVCCAVLCCTATIHVITVNCSIHVRSKYGTQSNKTLALQNLKPARYSVRYCTLLKVPDDNHYSN